MNKLSEKAFTLVELLIVIGIIGILAVTLLVSLNPAEAQRKSRDAKRLKDAALFESVIVQLINDGKDLDNSDIISSTGALSGAAENVQTQACNNSWLDVDVCDYAKTVPVDPLNNRNAAAVSAAGTTSSQLMEYRIRIADVDYEINVRQESISNATKVTGDGGTDSTMYEVFSNTSTLLGTAAPTPTP